MWRAFQTRIEITGVNYMTMCIFFTHSFILGTWSKTAFSPEHRFDVYHVCQVRVSWPNFTGTGKLPMKYQWGRV